MFNRQTTSDDSRDASAYSRRAAAADSIWAAQDRLRSGLPGALGRVADLAKWPFERAAFALQRKLIWPLEDRAEALGTPARALGAGAMIAVAAAAGVAGLIWAAPDKPGTTTTAVVATSPRPVEAKATIEKAAAPTLHGATPVFKPTKEEVASQVDPAKAIVKSSPAGAAPDSAAGSSADPATTASSSSSSTRPSSVDGPPAGPRAIAVANNFAGAFVLYETGKNDPAVRQAFGRTATPALAKALLRRPPRLPANVKVPKAKVVNVVPAPSRGRVYPVSVSLLRVGLTSELRLEMEHLKADGWRVTNVLG